MKIVIGVLVFAFQIYGQNVFLNEFRANSAGTDNGEFIEIIGPAGTDISNYQIIHYNGSGSTELFSFTFPDGAIIPDDGIVDNTGTPIGFLVVKHTGHTVDNADYEWGTSDLQNGPDGVELLDHNGIRIQALAYNGLGDLSGGSPPWRVVGNDANDDNSLSAPDGVQESLKNSWDYVAATPGALNTNQTSGDVSLPVSLSSFTARAGDGWVKLKWSTESEIENLGFEIMRAQSKSGDYEMISSYINNPQLAGQYNSNSRHDYQFTDRLVINDHIYWYKLIDVDANGVRHEHGPVNALPTREGAITIDKTVLPRTFTLHPNFPNPFNPGTTLRFDIPAGQNQTVPVQLYIYNALGQQVKKLFKGNLSAGQYEAHWQGNLETGEPAPGGLYFAVLKTDFLHQVRKMILLR